MLYQPPTRHDQSSVNYPRNTWWVAAFGDEVVAAPTERWMLDRPILLYRCRDGRVTALDNRCPHRWAPLSLGRLNDDVIECPYHGISFGPDGTCVNVPSQQRKNYCIQAYPVRESGPLVWVWMGDPARLDDYPPPLDLPWTRDPAWTFGKGVMDMECNYMMVHENVMDLTHFSFLHRNSLEQDDWTKPPTVSTTDTTVTFRQEFTDRKLSAGHRHFTGTPPERLADSFVAEGTWRTPAIHEASEQIEFRDPASSLLFKVVHAPTPIDMFRCRYHFLLGWDQVRPQEEVDAIAAMAPTGVFGEDKWMLEAIAKLSAKDTRGGSYGEIHLRADTPQLHARRKLEDLLKREQAAV